MQNKHSELRLSCVDLQSFEDEVFRLESAYNRPDGFYINIKKTEMPIELLAKIRFNNVVEFFFRSKAKGSFIEDVIRFRAHEIGIDSELPRETLRSFHEESIRISKLMVSLAMIMEAAAGTPFQYILRSFDAIDIFESKTFSYVLNPMERKDFSERDFDSIVQIIRDEYDPWRKYCKCELFIDRFECPETATVISDISVFRERWGL